MTFLIDRPLLLFVVAVAVLYGAVEVGFRLNARGETGDERRKEQLTATRDQVALVLSLMLGFTLSMALNRFDDRRQLLVDEANAIGTTMRRTALLPEPARTQSRPLLRDYVSTRLELSREGLEAKAAMARSRDIQNQLWEIAVTAADRSPTPITALYVESLNETIDLDEKRVAALENRIHFEVWVMLGLLSLLTALMSGRALQRKVLSSVFVVPLMIAIVITLIADLDTSGRGMIQVGRQSLERLEVDPGR